MITVNNNDSGLCNRIKLLGQALALGMEFHQDVRHNYFYDLKKYLMLDQDLLAINVLLPDTSAARIRFHNLIKPLSRRYHMIRKENIKTIRSRLAKGKSVTLNTWKIREPVGYIKYRDIISQYLAPKAEYQEYADAVLKEIHAESYQNRIAFHVRRGDYKSWRGGMYYFDDAAYIKWMRELISEFGKDTCILVFSNEEFDLEKAREQAGHRGIFLMKGNALQDLATMARCDYIVGPPSTYSEMAAYYGNGLYLNVYEREQRIHQADFQTLKTNYEEYYHVKIDVD